MQEILMHPFQKVFTEAHPKGTMSSYNTYDGVPVTGSPYFLTELLRNQYGFKGYVVSDSGAVERLYRQHCVAADFEDAIVQAVNAGLNVRTNFREMEHYVEPLRKVIKEGLIREETVNSRVADVLRVKFELGLFDNPVVDPQKALETVHCPAHQKVTLEAARKSMVLIKNDGILPLDSKKIRTLMVTGPGADDPGALTSRYGPALSDSITPLAGIKEFLGSHAKVLYTKGIDYKDKKFPLSDLLDIPLDDDEQAELDKAVDMAKTADAIVVVVGDNDDDTVSESHSRTSLNLPGHQLKLVQAMVKTGKPVVVALMAGRAASINWTDRNAPAILACWHGGEKAGQALAETLFGETNPGGKLPITFPRTAGQIPLCVPHRKGAWGGQKESPDENGWGRTRALDPLYYFGHGLSYTTFEYSNLTVSPQNPTADTPITISCNLTNTGDRAGDEVAQLYITDVVASVAPYDQLLRGFERVSLQPGETKTVTFTLSPRRDLKMLNRDNEWVVEPGKFEVKVGTSSAPDGIRQRGEFVLQ
jgi:beta-glucosidase